MKRISLISFILIILIILVLCSCSDKKMSTYEGFWGSFSISYPEEWTVEDDLELQVIFSSLEQTQDNLPIAEIEVEVILSLDEAENAMGMSFTSAKDLLDTSIEIWNQSQKEWGFPEANVLSKGEVRLGDNIEGYQYILENPVNRISRICVLREEMVQRQDSNESEEYLRYAYIIDFRAIIERFDDFEQIFDQSMASFKFIPF